MNNTKNHKTRIVWSGITGRTGMQATLATQNSDLAEIVAGVCRDSRNGYYDYEHLNDIEIDFGVIVDFSHIDSFDKILNFALEKKKPLVIGTAGLSDQQLHAIENASHTIPIFRGGNFRFEVKKFIDDVVEYAKTSNEEIKLIETHYKSKKIPSETAKVIAKRVLDETGKRVQIDSFLEYDELINDWRVGNLHCQVQGFEQLAKDVIQIASIMRTKPANGIYDLDRLVAEGL